MVYCVSSSVGHCTWHTSFCLVIVFSSCIAWHLQGMSAVRIIHFQFHTGFLSLDASNITVERYGIQLCQNCTVTFPSLLRSELDGSVPRNEEKYPGPFQLILDISVVPSEAGEVDACWRDLPCASQGSPLACFSSHIEQEDALRHFSRWHGLLCLWHVYQVHV